MTAVRMTQAQRRARTRDALLEATARGLSRHGYTNLALEQVARDAGYTRGALYHQFASKDDLVLATVEWIEETWWREMRRVLTPGAEPVTALCAVARTHAVLCRRDIARVRMVLTVEFSGRDHPIGKAVAAASERVLEVATALIEQGRRSKSIPPGPPAHVAALAVLGAVEGLVSHLAGHVAHDELLAERAVLGVLGLTSPTPAV
jgi:AcrR family transcriptional regulator